jgi:hypothetical protein
MARVEHTHVPIALVYQGFWTNNYAACPGITKAVDSEIDRVVCRISKGERRVVMEGAVRWIADDMRISIAYSDQNKNDVSSSFQDSIKA